MASHEEVFFAVEPKKRKKYIKNILKKDLTYCIPFGTLITIRKERGGRKMKIQVWLRKDGEESVVKTYIGKDWKGIRCYFNSPKGAFVDYKSNTFVITRSRSVKLGEWRELGNGNQEKYEFIKEG